MKRPKRPSDELKELPCALPGDPFRVGKKLPEFMVDDVIVLELLLFTKEFSTDEVPTKLEFC